MCTVLKKAMNLRVKLLQFMWLSATLPNFTTGARLQFYRNQIYTDLFYESFFTETCNNLPENGQVGSFTTDICVVQYWHSDCRSPNGWKVLQGNCSAPIGYYYLVQSFRICNDEEGGSQLNIDITKYYDIDKPENVHDILEKYKKVCSCYNVPDYVQKMEKWSIDNHANYFVGYYEPDCLENKFAGTMFRPGNYDDVRNIYNFTKTDNITEKQYNILSFGPYPNSTYPKLSYKNTFEFLQQTHIRDIHEIVEKYHGLKEDNASIKTKVADFEVKNLIFSNKIVELEARVKTSELEMSTKLNEQKNGFENFTDIMKRDLLEIFA